MMHNELNRNLSNSSALSSEYPGRIMRLSPPKIIQLAYFEEAVGILHEIIEQDGVLIALIGKIHLYLPLDLEHSFRPLIGKRIAILHTDIAAKQYLFRLLDQETTSHKKASVQEDCISI